VNYRFCHRCQAELPPHDEGTLIFCTQCGAAQILLSEDLLTQIEDQAKATEDGAAAAATTSDTRSLAWTGALHYVAAAGGVAAVLAGASMLVPGISLMTSLWAVISPVIVIGLFQTRFPLAPMSASFGARLGLLTGLAVSAGLSVVFTITAMIARFGTKSLGPFDEQWSVMLEQWKIRVAGQPAADVAAVTHMFSVPEFRAGMVLFTVAFCIAVLLVITTTGGAFAGFVRSRRRASI
jgi:hypothetical protein